MKDHVCTIRRHRIATALVTVFAAHAYAATVDIAPWLSQMGVTATIQSAAARGYGQLLGVVDTGIVANNAEFAPNQVSLSLSKCAAVTFRCSNGAYDDNGHGTAVASIAAGNRTLYGSIKYGGSAYQLSNTVVAVAPNANIVAEKVLNSQGSGYSTDVNNGIIQAANAGATVINLSLTYNNTPATIAAVNYAASKGAFIVWAGGNDARILLNGLATSGLTPTAISHLIFVGSVDANNRLSSFSNTPGSGALVASTGTRSSYAARWIMAPGENIVAPYTPAGSNVYAYWTGTSMSAPLISGSLMLLESAWPILKTNGTAANLLLATATDLGARGVDGNYGNGIVNLGMAFNPYGTLTITASNGRAIPVSNLSGSMIVSGTLGNFTAVKTRLASYTALDSYSRNFLVDLSGLIQTRPTSAMLNPLPTTANVGPKKISFADGAQLTYVSMADAGHEASGYAMLTDHGGNTVGFTLGSAMTTDYLYANTLYGDEAAAVSAAEIANNLSAYTAGGVAMAYGVQWTTDTRIAVTYSTTKPTTASNMTWTTTQASVFGAGIAKKVNTQLQFGIMLQSLEEPHGLLGSSFGPGGGLGLDGAAHTDEIGLSALISMDARNSFYVEAVNATTRSNAGNGGVLADMSALRSQAYGASFAHQQLFTADDKLTLSVKQPLRVSAGSVGLAVTNIDPVTGVPSLGIERVSVAPDGRELDYKIGYTAHYNALQTFGFEAGYRVDSMNVAGNNVFSIGANWMRRF